MIETSNKKMRSVFDGIGIAALLCVLMVLMSWSAVVTNSDINSVDSSANDSTLDETPATSELLAEKENSEPQFLSLIHI